MNAGMSEKSRNERFLLLIASTPNYQLVNTPPAKAGGFGLRLKAGFVGHAADYTT
jgi:hypothetical protein